MNDCASFVSIIRSLIEDASEPSSMYFYSSNYISYFLRWASLVNILLRRSLSYSGGRNRSDSKMLPTGPPLVYAAMMFSSLCFCCLCFAAAAAPGFSCFTGNRSILWPKVSCSCSRRVSSAVICPDYCIYFCFWGEPKVSRMLVYPWPCFIALLLTVIESSMLIFTALFEFNRMCGIIIIERHLGYLDYKCT